MNKTYDIYFWGVLCLDHILRLDAPPSDVRNAHVLAERVTLGGDATNSAAAAARLGLQVVLQTNPVGRDASGRLVGRELRRRRQRLLSFQTVARPTPRAFILALPDGGRAIVSAFGEKRIAPPRRDVIARSRIFCLDNYFGAASRRAAELARRSGAFLAANNLSPDQPHLVLCDVVFLPSPEGDRRQAAALLRRAARRTRGTVVVTMGRDGCLAQQSGGPVRRQPAFPVAVVDSTGAGDNFRAAYLYAQLQGWPLAGRLRFAAAFAALSCRGLGAGGRLPTVAAVERLLLDKPAVITHAR